MVMGLEDMNHRGYGNLKTSVIYISLIIFIIYKNGPSIINTEPILHRYFILYFCKIIFDNFHTYYKKCNK